MAFLNPAKPDQPAAGGGGSGGAQLGGGGPSTVGTPVFDPDAGTLTYPDGSVAHLTPDEVYWHKLIRGDDWKGPVFADRKSTRLNSSHLVISYAVFCLIEN